MRRHVSAVFCDDLITALTKARPFSVERSLFARFPSRRLLRPTRR